MYSSCTCIQMNKSQWHGWLDKKKKKEKKKRPKKNLSIQHCSFSLKKNMHFIFNVCETHLFFFLSFFALPIT